MNACTHARRLISAVDYKAMNDSDRFLWMKRTQNSRLILGRSGIEVSSLSPPSRLCLLSLSSLSPLSPLSLLSRFSLSPLSLSSLISLSFLSPLSLLSLSSLSPYLPPPLPPTLPSSLLPSLPALSLSLSSIG